MNNKQKQTDEKIKCNGQYWRALIATFFMIIVIAIGSILLSTKTFSFNWFVGAFFIGCIYLISFYINYKFIIFNEGDKK